MVMASTMATVSCPWYGVDSSGMTLIRYVIWLCNIQDAPGWCSMSRTPAIRLRATPVPGVTPSVTPTAYFVYRQCAEIMCQQINNGVPCAWGENITPVPDKTGEIARLTAREYSKIYLAIKETDPTARVFCCGQYYAHDTSWWSAFIEEMRRLRDGDQTATPIPSLGFDGIHLHVYPYTGSTDCNTNLVNEIFNSCLRTKLQTYMADFHTPYPETRGKPFWITEYGFLYVPTTVPTPTGAEIRNWLMAPVVGFFWDHLKILVIAVLPGSAYRMEIIEHA